MFVVAGEFDAGYAVETILRNASGTGEVGVVAILSTSEGNFRRAQNIVIEEGKSVKLRYEFHEPTINADNVQGQISCSPG